MIDLLLAVTIVEAHKVIYIYIYQEGERGCDIKDTLVVRLIATSYKFQHSHI